MGTLEGFRTISNQQAMELILTGILTFLSTNIDDLFGSVHTYREWHIRDIKMRGDNQKVKIESSTVYRNARRKRGRFRGFRFVPNFQNFGTSELARLQSGSQ